MENKNTPNLVYILWDMVIPEKEDIACADLEVRQNY